MVLDTNERQQIREFKIQTGSDRTTAYIFLTATNWNVELAVTAYNHAEKCNFIKNQRDLLEELKREFNIIVSNTIDLPDFSDDSSYSEEDDIKTIPTTSYIRTIYDYTFGWIISSVYNAIYGLFYLLRKIIMGSNQPNLLERKTCDSTTYFIEKYDELYGPRHVNFSRYTLIDTLYEAVNKKKPVLIFLNDSFNQVSTFFCNFYFSNIYAMDLLDSMFEIWAVDSTSKDGIDAQNRWGISPSTLTIMSSHDDATFSIQLSINEPIPVEIFLRRFKNSLIFPTYNDPYYPPYTSDIDAQEDSLNATTSLINQQNEEYDRLLTLEKSKQDMMNLEKERKNNKFLTSAILSQELADRAEKAKIDFEERTSTSLDTIEPSKIVNFRIYYPDRKSTHICCLKHDPIKRVIDHIFISYPKIPKKFKLSNPIKKNEFFRYGDDENVTCENCSLDSSYRINLAYVSSDEDSSETDTIDNTP